MENNKIKVSVIMPVYNSGKYLKTAVDSILSQSLKEIELILVDDGSTDGSSERCDEYAAKDSRVVVIHQKNGGICNARNAALKIARGEYIGFSDHDDEYSPGQLEDNYFLGVDNNADIVKFGSRRFILNDGTIVQKKDRGFKKGIYKEKDLKEKFFSLWRNNVFNGVWDSLFKRKFLQSNNILFDSYYKNGGEDFDFCWQCIGKLSGGVIFVNDRIYYNHYIRTGFSTSAKFNKYSITVAKERPAKLFSHIQNLNLDINSQKTEYIYFWLQMSLGSICHCLANPNCDIKKSRKFEILEELKQEAFFKSWILDCPAISIKKIAPLQYVMLLWFYQHNMYWLCLKLYSIQYKYRRQG